MMNDYTVKVIQTFASHANREQAEAMEAYMRDQFEYFGLRMPVRNALTKQLLQEHGIPAPEELRAVVTELWRQPQRELQYFALTLMEKSVKRMQPSDDELLEKLVTEKSWWDTVDSIASNLAGPYFVRYPDQIGPVTGRWMDSGHMWLQRTALLFQLKYKKKTDASLLFAYIVRLIEHDDFFIRKAIGWSLREYAKSDAETVLAFVREHESRLSPLSRKEALKHFTLEKAPYSTVADS